MPRGLLYGDAPIELKLGDRRLFIVEKVARDPDVAELQTTAPFFAKDSLGIRPTSEAATALAASLGDSRANLPIIRCSEIRR